MPIQIDEVTSVVRVVDGDSLLSPRVLRQLLDAVMRALEDERRRDDRMRSERRVTGGVSAERDEER